MKPVLWRIICHPFLRALWHSVRRAAGQLLAMGEGDVTNLALMQDLMKGVDGVFHLAAIALVAQARQFPLETYRTNTLGTATVLESLRDSDSVNYALFVTTDKVYKPNTATRLWAACDLA